MKNKIIDFLYFFIPSFIVVVPTTMVIIYYSYDVQMLDDHYPTISTFKGDLPVWKLKKDRPRGWVSLNKISKVARWSIILSEDWAFYEHKGVDFNQLEQVLKESLEKRKLLRGASTISQQVIKNIFLSPEKTLWRKFKEWVLTYKLERLISKQRILEIYFNIIHLGKGIYGLQTASKHYFSKSPRSLTAREGAFLAMLLPNPVRYSVSFRNRRLTDFAQAQIEQILQKLHQAKIINEVELRIALNSRFFWESYF